MALYRFDGWDYYPAAGSDVQVQTKADGWYDSVGALTTYAGRFGKGLSLGFTIGNFATGVAEGVGKRWDAGETCVIGQAFYIPPGNFQGFMFGTSDVQGGNGRQFWLQFEDVGVIRLYRGGNSSVDASGGALVATSAAKVWHEDEWDYVEVKFIISDTAGMVEVRVNKVVVISYLGRTSNLHPAVLSLPSGWDTLFYQGGINNTDDFGGIRWDDRYILDNTGSNNTDYLGNVRVNLQKTTAPGDLTDMSVFGATANWDAVNDTPLDDTEYVYSSLVGDRDLYTMDPNVTAQNIFGIQVVGAWRQDDATQMNGHHLIKTGGVVYEGGDNNLAQTYHYYRNVWELNPFTGVGWTAADLNAIQAGQKLLAG